MSGVEILQVQDQENGMRLDRWFKSHYPMVTHGRLQKLLRTGQIRVDGARAKSNTRLETGQNLRIPPLNDDDQSDQKPTRSLSEEDENFVQNLVLYIDDDIIAINKPPGLAVQGGSKTKRHLDEMLDGLKFGLDERPRLVHRLDKDTSGLLLLARKRKSASYLAEALKRRNVVKKYWALVAGVPRRGEGVIKVPLVKKIFNGHEKVVPAEQREEGAQVAETKYIVVDQAGQRYAWLEMQPVTGRTHQLRVHAAFIGHPILGDTKYGDRNLDAGGELTSQLHLHARSIEVPLADGGILSVTAPLPVQMMKSWELLGFDCEISCA